MNVLNNILEHAPVSNTPDFSVKDFYKGKNVFISGVTGFLGKVVLEKILRCQPDVGNIYIMVRPKRNKKPIDRLKEEIFSSHIFSILKRERKNFMEWIEAKCIPISGDLVLNGLGISEEEHAILT